MKTDKLKPLAPTEDSPVTLAPAPATLSQPSQFALDHEAEAMAAIVQGLLEDAAEFDARSITRRLAGNHEEADDAADKARSLRYAVKHLQA